MLLMIVPSQQQGTLVDIANDAMNCDVSVLASFAHLVEAV